MASFKGKNPFVVARQLRFKNGVNVETLAAALTLTTASSHFQKLDPGGAGRTVTLPAVSDGAWFFISNAADAAENLTINNASAVLVVTLNQNEAAWVVCDASAWTHMGVQTIALT